MMHKASFLARSMEPPLDNGGGASRSEFNPQTNEKIQSAPSEAPQDRLQTEADNDFAALRRIIIGSEQEKIARLELRLNNPELRAQDIRSALPRAISLCDSEGDHFSRAITPAVESALERSVQRDSSVLVRAIFPILGPAIRKAIGEAFHKLLQGLNKTLEHSISIQGLKWRLEALRTGKSFGEIVLSHTLVYRVEQVFLIHRKTSLLLQHAQIPSITTQDGDMVSSMLAAIQDFVRQSFSVEQGDALNTLQVGELNVWVEAGPQATLAIVIRGHASMDLRPVLQGALERIHAQFGAALESFEGDTSPFDATRPDLESCMLLQSRGSSRKPPYRTWCVILVVLLFLGIWIVSVMRENRRWNLYVDRLRAEDGIMVAESAKRWGKFFITGLRDSLAADPKQLLLDSGVNTNKVVSRWELYEATTPRWIVYRAIKRLAPPPGVSLQAQNGVLYASGVAPDSWTQLASRMAVVLPGVSEFDTIGLATEKPLTLPKLKKQIENVSIFFEEDGDSPDLGQDEVLTTLVDRIKEAVATATSLKQQAKITVVGHANSRGGEDYNLRLSQRRAESVSRWLVQHGIDSQRLSVTGIGTREPLRKEIAEEDSAQNRRVSFRLSLEPATAVSPAR